MCYGLRQSTPQVQGQWLQDKYFSKWMVALRCLPKWKKKIPYFLTYFLKRAITSPQTQKGLSNLVHIQPTVSTDFPDLDAMFSTLGASEAKISSILILWSSLTSVLRQHRILLSPSPPSTPHLASHLTLLQPAGEGKFLLHSKTEVTWGWGSSLTPPWKSGQDFPQQAPSLSPQRQKVGWWWPGKLEESVSWNNYLITCSHGGWWECSGNGWKWKPHNTWRRLLHCTLKEGENDHSEYPITIECYITVWGDSQVSKGLAFAIIRIWVWFPEPV